MANASKLTWLHISDFHFKSNKSYERDVVTNALIDSLPTLATRISKPDFVIASGDIAFSGKAAEYQQATLFFEKVLGILGLSKNELIIVPGNHDVDRSQSIGLTRTLGSTEEAFAYFSSGEDLKHAASKLKAFADWYAVFFEGKKVFPLKTTCLPIERFVSGETHISVLPINSSSFCVDDNDSGKLFIGRPCIESAVAAFQKPTSANSANICVLHHPFGWLSQLESTQIKSSLREQSDCILTGHLHSTDIEEVWGLSGDTLHLSAGATFDALNKPNTAMICSLDDGQIIVTPIRYSDTPKPQWTVDPSIYPGEPKYSKAYTLKRNEQTISPPVSAIFTEDQPLSTDRAKFNENLLTAPSGEHLYVDHRLVDRPQVVCFDEEEPEHAVYTVRDIANSDKSFFVLAKAEFGGTTFCQRLELEFLEQSKTAVLLCDARKLPNYKRKLEIVFERFVKSGVQDNVLILDNFDFEQDERLLKEIEACKCFCRVVAVIPDRGLEINVPSENIGYMKDRVVLHIWGLSRENIRTLASIICGSTDQVFISEVVDKVYRDLLALCIPLTANNAVMYLRILNREGSYIPINRVDIVEKYLHALLQGPGDTGGRDINAKNKMDILSAFCLAVYESRRESFDDAFWFLFVERYQKDTLFEFDGSKLLRDLFSVRIFFRIGPIIFIRYNFHFEFFLGRYLASRPLVLARFIDEEEYLRITGTVEVITGLSSNNDILLDKLTTRAEELQREFAVKYVNTDFDIIQAAKWVDHEDEEEKVWLPVAQQIEAGPKQTSEIDDIKSSFIAEARTSDQQIRFSKFVALEVALFAVGRLLKNALRNCDDADGVIKTRAYNAVARSSLVAFQVGTMLAPRMAVRRYTTWGGVSFFDFNRAVERHGSADASKEEKLFLIVKSLGESISSQDSAEIATHKLAPVFREEAKKIDGNSFLGVFAFLCILLSKGNHWEESLSAIITKTDKNAFYLYYMLRALLSELKYEILQSKDREAVKRLIALVQAKRLLGKQKPGAKAIRRTTELLKAAKYAPFNEPLKE